MPITAEQCRAARALLDWSQVELSDRAQVAKKTIVDFERGVRAYHGGTAAAVESALTGHGVEFIPENGGGPGVRLRKAMPRLFRRDDKGQGGILFAFDYKAKRTTGFISDQVLEAMGLYRLPPLEAFDHDRTRILITAAEKVDNDRFDSYGRVVLNADDLPPIVFDSPRAGWKVCVTKFPGTPEIFDQFERLFTEAGAPPDHALFSRTTRDFMHEIFLVSPAAGEWTPKLGGNWTDAGDPRLHKWSLSIGVADAAQTLGITLGQDMG